MISHALLAVDSVKWARSQMAFTLAFHIVLASLGVALPATILVANYIGLKKKDHDAIELAQRWSKESIPQIAPWVKTLCS